MNNLSPSVLIAEDEVIIREALRHKLEQRFTVVASVGDGQSAVDGAEEHRPDIALLDISMPVMNGLDAADLIHEGSPEVTVIFVSSHAEPAYVEEAFRRGAKGYVLKGRLAELFQAIQTVFSGGVHRPEFLGSASLAIFAICSPILNM